MIHCYKGFTFRVICLVLGQSFFSSETQQWDPQLVIGWHASYVRCKYCLKTTFLASFLKALLRGTKHETTKMQRLDFRVELSIKWAIKISLLGREPWSSGYRRRLMIWRLWVQILAPCTGWTFFHIYLLHQLYWCLFEKTQK